MSSQRPKYDMPLLCCLCLLLGLALSGCDSAEKPIPAVEPPKLPPRSATAENRIASPSKTSEASATADPGANSPQGQSTPNVSAGAIAERLHLPSTAEKVASPPASPPSKERMSATKPSRDAAGGERWLSDDKQLPIDYWEALYRSAKRIGVNRYRIERTSEGQLRLTLTSHMPLAGKTKPMRRVVILQSLEQPNGQMETFSESTKTDEGTTTVTGDLRLGSMRLQSSSGTKAVAIPAGCWGPLGIQQLLLRKPMQPGEIREAQIFLRQTHQVASIRLIAGQPEDTTNPDGLLRAVIPIEAIMQLEKEGIRVQMWTDDQGWIQKTIWPEGLSFSSFRVPTEVGQRMVDETEFEILRTAKVSVTENLKKADQLDQAEYYVESTQADPHESFSSQTNQTTKIISAFKAQVNVFRSQDQGPLPEGLQQKPPTEECTGSSVYINSKDPVVVALANSLAKDERVPVVVATQLNSGLRQVLQLQPSVAGIKTATEVIQSRMGGASDYAVVLTAMLRSRGVPARLASGIRLHSESSSTYFAHQFWTEAWIGDRWLALDPSTGQPTGCGYIKFLETPLEGANPYAAVLPVLKMLDKLKITLQ